MHHPPAPGRGSGPAGARPVAPAGPCPPPRVSGVRRTSATTLGTSVERILDAPVGGTRIRRVSLLAAGRISRPGLARRIADGLEAGSVLLVAGAGYGKTMALEEA